jgi:hypothetical protein
VRDYAELLDNILIKLNSADHNNFEQDKQILVQLLKELGNSTTTNLTIRYFGLVLDQKLRQNLVLVGEKMSSQSSSDLLDSEDTKILEEFAEFLEDEQIQAAARIRGLR